nr:TetR/AcrR family transcriptional regulator [Neobacillus sp. Marseille-Q6967]
MKEKIRHAGIQLFDENGFKSTSINDIVDFIGVTKGTFYYYFSSKEELLKDIQLLYIEDLIKQQQEILSNPSTSCTEKLFEIVYLLIKNIRVSRQSARILFREMRHLSEKNLQDIHDKRNRFRENTQQLIEHGISNGEIKGNSRADILTFGILGITNWSYYWFNPDGEISEEQLAKIYVDMILNGITSSHSTSLENSFFEKC